MVETAWIALRKIEIFMHAQESPKSTNLHAKHVVRHVSDRGPKAYCKVHLKSLVQHIRTSDSQYQTLERGSASTPLRSVDTCAAFRRALYLLSTALAALPWHILAFLGSRALREYR